MNTTESFQGSIGIDSFLTPHKPNTSSTMRTLPSFNSLQYSQISNRTLGFETISKLISHNSVDQRKFPQPKFAAVPEEQDGINYEKRQDYLINLQKLFLPLYYLSKKQAVQSKELEQNIADQQRKNKLKKSYLKHQKTNIENLVQKLRKEKQKMIRKQEKYFQQIKGQINNAKQRIYQLQNQINQIQSKPVQKTHKKKNRRKEMNIPQPIFYVVGGYQDSSKSSMIQLNHHQNPAKIKSDKEGVITYSHTNPLNYVQQIFKNSGTHHSINQHKTQNLSQKPSNHNFVPHKESSNAGPFVGNFGDLLGHVLMKKIGTNQQQSPGPINSVLQKKASASSQNWQNGDEEKDIIDILQKSEKKSENKIIKGKRANEEGKQFNMKMTTSKVQQVNIQQSKVNIKIDQSSQMGSKFSIEKRKKPHQFQSIKQSIIRLDVSEQNSHSFSKSREGSSDKSYPRKKSPTEQYSPTFRVDMEPKNFSDMEIKLRKVTEQESELIGSSKINKKSSKGKAHKHQYRNSEDIGVNEMVIDEQNIKESQIINVQNTRLSTIQQKSGVNKNIERKITDPDEEDDDELFSINLLAVSKISKQKQLSDKAFGSISDDGEPIKTRSNILRKNKNPNTLRGTNAHNKKMSRIQQDILEEQKEKQEERKRKNSGKYSMILTSSAKNQHNIRKSGASSPVNQLK